MMVPRTLALLCACLALATCQRRTPERPPPAPANAAPRIVTLSPALGVIVRDLGLADRVVGRDGFDMVLPRSLPVCGDYSAIDNETLARVNPTHVLLQWGARERPRRLENTARERGWIVRDFQIITLDEIGAATAELGALLGAEPRAQALAAAMDQAWSRRPGAERAGRILLLESVSPPAALGPGSWHAQILERLGGLPALREGKPYVRLDAEDVARVAPDGIIFFAPAAPGGEARVVRGQAAASMLGALAKLEIPAVRRGRVAVLTDPLALTPSTAMIGLAEQMASLLEQWRTEPDR